MQPFVDRRTRLQKNLDESDAFLIYQPKQVLRNGDVHYPFHPNRYFYYLSGFEEPDAWLLITHNKTYLWSTEEDKTATIWNGPVLADKAILELHIDHWESTQKLSSLSDLLKPINNLFLIGDLPQGIQYSGKTADGISLIDHMRIIKDRYEINVITQSCEISSIAVNFMIENAKNAKHETALLGYFMQSIMEQGISSLAYPPIIAGGKNALTLHYTSNNQALRPGDLVLVDVGGEYQQYAADISRTFPVNGQFSSQQQALYEACLDVQESTIKMVQPGTTLSKLHEHAVLNITQHLIDLKIINTSLETAIEEKLFMQYFPHKVGHTLGLDVHDISPIDQVLKPGMVITVEPGIYVADKGKFQNTGIRIEDDILITDTGYKNLTSKAIKSIHDIHNLMK